MKTQIGAGVITVVVLVSLACSGGASAPEGYQEVQTWRPSAPLTIWCIGFDDCGVMDDSATWRVGPGCRIDTSRSFPMKSQCDDERGYVTMEGTFVAHPENGVAHEQGSSEGRLWIQDAENSQSHEPLGRIYGWWLYDENMRRIGVYGQSLRSVSVFDGGVASVVLADGRVTTVSMDGTVNSPPPEAQGVEP